MGRTTGWTMAMLMVATQIAVPASAGEIEGSTAARLVGVRGYPGAFAVCATPTDVRAEVAGVVRVGGRRVRSTDRFPIGSLTKSFTATLAALLVQDQLVEWDTRLLDVFPELVEISRPEYGDVTLRDLLAHRGGIVTPEDLAALPPLSGTLAEQREEYTQCALAQPASTQPGREVAYSNGGYVVAAAMLERVAGQPYEAAVRQHLFAPLGLRPAFGAPGAGGASEPWGHVRKGVRWIPVRPAEASSLLPEALNPAGLLKLSARDLGLYLQLHVRALGGETGLLLTPETARVLHAEVQDGAALGWFVFEDPRRGRIDFHDGSDDLSYYTLMALLPGAARACAVGVTGLRTRAPDDIDAALDRQLRSARARR